MHVLTDGGGIVLAVAVTGANVHDSQALKPLVMAIPALRSRRGPRRRRPGRLYADKAYDQPELRRRVRRRGIVVRIARRGVESRERLGRHRCATWAGRSRSFIEDRLDFSEYHETSR